MGAVAIVLLVLLGLRCYGGDVRCNAQKLVKGEVNALKKIGTKLKKQWDFTVDPCSNTTGWVDPPAGPYIVNNLTCNCTTISCHVINIRLMGQNLTGELPAEFASLPQLKFLDLTFNYLNGTIPAAWASLPLTHLSLLGNRISGRIPDELGSMITLQDLCAPVPAGQVRSSEIQIEPKSSKPVSFILFFNLILHHLKIVVTNSSSYFYF